MSHGLEDRMFGKARAQAVHAQLFLIDDGHEEVGRDERDRSLKTGRRHTDDGVRMLVEADLTADDARIALEAGVPISVSENDIRGAVGAALIGGMEEAAEIGMNPQHVEVVAGGCKAVCVSQILARVQTDAQDHVEGCQILEAVVTIAQVEIVGIRLPGRIVAEVGSVRVLGLGHVERSQDETVHEAENDGIGADGQSEGGHGGDGDAARPAQLAKGESEVDPDGLDSGPLPNLAAALLKQSSVAESDPGLPFGFLCAHAFVHQFVRCALQCAGAFLQRDRCKSCGGGRSAESSPLETSFRWLLQLVVALPGFRTSEMPSNMRSKLEICCSRWLRPAAVI